MNSVRHVAALTRFNKPKDPHTGIHTPILPADPGVVHIIRATRKEVARHDPWFVEDPEDYRAALCGTRVKVILSMPLSKDDPQGCGECRRLLKGGARPGVDYWTEPTPQELRRRLAYWAREDSKRNGS